MPGKYFNAHSHCFTIDHVPEDFFEGLLGGKRFLRISKIRKSAFLRAILRVATSGPVCWVVKFFAKDAAAQMRRLRGLLKYGLMSGQYSLLEILDQFYSFDYRYVLLTMDMECMKAGKPKLELTAQLDELQSIKALEKYRDIIFPFVFADPRRTGITALVKQRLEAMDAPFQGIKLYPALGYFPFDRGLKDMYHYAIANNVPLLTHCIVGDVYYRDALWEQIPLHPISGQSTVPEKKYKDPVNFQLNFSHPLNYECLLNPVIASRYFGQAVDLSQLKLCIGHFGGETEWELEADQQKEKADKYANVFAKDPLDIDQPWLGADTERYSWLTIIKAMLRKYPNLYADISFTLHEKKIYPVLKEMLADPVLRNKILFGTDYYVVATISEENSLIKLVQEQLTAAELKLIAYDNPLRYLSSNINPIAV